MMVHVTEPDGSEEIIHSTEVEKDKWHIIRTIVRTVFRSEAETLDFSSVTVLDKRAETLILSLPI
jgi:hypothetical protein